ncbi:MAG: LamB/YcsF family protein [Granulosicoccus sp.]
MRLNLNADLGESFGAWQMGDDENLLKVVNSANVACGFHAGDPLVMSQTITKAKQHAVSIGAHPGFADLQGFGRRQMVLNDAEVCSLVLYQLAALGGMAQSHGYAMTHIKPHGAINNMACEDRHLADVIVNAVQQFDPALIFLAPVLSELEFAARDAGLLVAGEIFADRAYAENGTLVSRREPGAVLDSAEDCIEHVRRMINAQGLVTVSGKILRTDFKSICVHGDNAHAVDTARQINMALRADGHQLVTLPELMN